MFWKGSNYINYLYIYIYKVLKKKNLDQGDPGPLGPLIGSIPRSNEPPKLGQKKIKLYIYFVFDALKLKF